MTARLALDSSRTVNIRRVMQSVRADRHPNNDSVAVSAVAIEGVTIAAVIMIGTTDRAGLPLPGLYRIPLNLDPRGSYRRNQDD